MMSSCLMVTGCASLYNGGQKSIVIETVNAESGSSVESTCSISSDTTSLRIPSNQPHTIQRDSQSLVIDCHNSETRGQAQVNSALLARYVILDLATDFCIVSCWIDAYSGAWREYPSPVVVNMVAAH
jgi:hypothetical protein